MESYSQMIETLDRSQLKMHVIVKNLSRNEWKTIEKIIEVFESAYFLTKELQRKTCTLSDFYGLWLRMEISVKKCLTSAQEHTDEMEDEMEDEIENDITFDLPQKMLDAMDGYRGQLLNNPMLLAAVFLDPRFSCYLKVPYKNLAITKLLKVWERIRSQQNNNVDDSIDDIDELESYLAESSLGANATEKRKIHDLLESFAQQPAEKAKTSILEYWETHKHLKPELYRLSRVVYCVAPTQAPTERANSALSFVFSRYRSKMDQKMLEDILIIRPNSDLFNWVVEERLSKILTTSNPKILSSK